MGQGNGLLPDGTKLLHVHTMRSQIIDCTMELFPYFLGANQF